MVIDDRELRIDSANFNNRSMHGDSECDILITSEDDQTASTIIGIRNGLLAEHLGRPVEEITAALEQTGSLIATVEQLRAYHGLLRPYVVPNLSAVAAWLADNEVLDPEWPEEMFEPITHRDIFRGRLSRPKQKHLAP